MDESNRRTCEPSPRAANFNGFHLATAPELIIISDISGEDCDRTKEMDGADG